MRYITWILLVSLCISCQQTAKVKVPSQIHNPFSSIDNQKVEDILSSMSLDEKIGQLLILSNKYNNECIQDSLDNWVEDGRLGGVMLKNLTVDCYVGKIDTLQHLAKTPLFVGTDELVSMSNTFSEGAQFPNKSSMGAIKSDTIHAQVNDLLLRQAKALGINFCLGPEINQNTIKDTAYNFDVFRNDFDKVTSNSFKFAATMQNNEILSIARHLNDLEEPKYIDSSYVYTDQMLFEKTLAKIGISGFVLDERELNKEENNASPKNNIYDFIREYLEFDGLLFSRVKDESQFLPYFYAGSNAFIINSSPIRFMDQIKSSIADNLMTEDDINDKVRKVIQAKLWLGFEYNRPAVIDTISAYTYINHPKLEYYTHKLYKQSISIPNNKDCALPLNNTFIKRVRWMHFGTDKFKEFQDQLSYYYGSNLSPSKRSDSLEIFKENFYKSYTTIVSLNDLNVNKVKDLAFIEKINKLSQKTKVILVNFGNPNNLLAFDSTNIMIQAFESNIWTERYTAQAIFGGYKVDGIPPFELFKCSNGLPKTRLAYTDAEEVQVDHKKLYGIRTVVNRAIKARAIPGCQILVAKDGAVIYNQSFGNHTYAKKKGVKNSDLYDIASLTKTTSTTVSLMKLYDQKKFSLNNKVKDFFEIENNWRFGNISMKNLLLHNTGLQPNMPIAPYIRKKDNDAADCNKYLCTEKTDTFNIHVAENIWFKGTEEKEIWNKILKLKPRKRARFRYSDINFVILQRILEKQAKVGLGKYANTNFFKPLKMSRCLYNPMGIFPRTAIIPSANDERWRKQLIHGYVHDESAALLHGVAGNAGLFSNAESLVPIYQMLLNKGRYGGSRFINPKTIQTFTQTNYGSKRALGFDRLNKSNRKQSCSKKCSSQSYGHTGFTGTMVWVDPRDDLIFVFLSNRVYPNPKNWKINKMKIRNKIHDIVYESLGTYDNSLPNWDKEILQKRGDSFNTPKTKDISNNPKATFVTQNLAH